MCGRVVRSCQNWSFDFIQLDRIIIFIKLNLNFRDIDVRPASEDGNQTAKTHFKTGRKFQNFKNFQKFENFKIQKFETFGYREREPKSTFREI